MSHAYRNVFGFDTETDHDEDQAWIAQWAVSDGKNEVTGFDHADFRDWLLEVLEDGRSIFLYAHNLSYDWEFVKYSVFNLVQRFECELYLNRRQGKMITATLKMGKSKGSIQFRDSAAKFPGTLENLARQVGMKKLQGFDFYPGWSTDIDLTDPKNWEYVKTDARIVAVAMRQMHRDGFVKSTSSGDCWMDAKRELRHKHGKRFWENHFPILSLDLDTALRKGYRGGINISRHHGRNTGTIVHEDVNSMYPTVMKFDPLPYGKPFVTTCQPENDETLYIVKCRIKIHLREGRIPWFTFGNFVDADMEGLQATDPVSSCDHFHDMTLTNIDLRLLNEFYTIELDPECEPLYWCWSSMTGIFSDYIDKWTEIKQQNKGVNPMMYQKAKLMMNGLYGRFALNPDTEHYELFYDEMTDDLDYRSVSETVENADAFLPYAIFITSWARARLLDQVTLIGDDNVIHCDTDSIIHLGEPSPEGDYGSDLGQWDIEERPIAIYEGGFKRYIEVLKEGEPESEKWFSVACAGVPQRTDPHHDNLPIGMWVELLDNPGLIITGHELGDPDYRIKSEWLRRRYIEQGMDPDHVNTMKLIPRRVRGGVILEERKHKLSDGLVTRFRCRL